MLARRGRRQTAVLWEQSLTRVTRDLARRHLEQLDRLERVRGMRLSTIRDRSNERFIKPLALDRLCALIEPAMLEARQEGERPSFARLQQELQTLHGDADGRRSRCAVLAAAAGDGSASRAGDAHDDRGAGRKFLPRTAPAAVAGTNCNANSAIGNGQRCPDKVAYGV